MEAFFISATGTILKDIRHKKRELNQLPFSLSFHSSFSRPAKRPSRSTDVLQN